MSPGAEVRLKEEASFVGVRGNRGRKERIGWMNTIRGIRTNVREGKRPRRGPRYTNDEKDEEWARREG